jgi:hypothetical protein
MAVPAGMRMGVHPTPVTVLGRGDHPLDRSDVDGP